MKTILQVLALALIASVASSCGSSCASCPKSSSPYASMESSESGDEVKPKKLKGTAKYINRVSPQACDGTTHIGLIPTMKVLAE